MDCPWWLHWPKLPLWLLWQGANLGLSVVLASGLDDASAAATGANCHTMTYVCRLSGECMFSQPRALQSWAQFFVPPPPPSPPPPPPPTHIIHAATATALSSIILSCMVIYLIAYCIDSYRSFSSLKQLPYNKFRMANVALRLEVWLPATHSGAANRAAATLALTPPCRCASGRLASFSSP